MDKQNRYSFIQNLIEKNSAGRMEATKADAEEEKNLVSSSDNDQSILDEEEKDSFVNPVLAVKFDTRLQREEEKEDDTLISKREMRLLSKELGRPVSFLGVKRSEEKEESLALPEGESVEELCKWAEEKANS